MRQRALAALALGALALGVVAAQSGDEGGAGGGTDRSAACPVIDSRNWVAWINAMPSVDGSRTLHIAGEVDLPTPGYEASWAIGPADRRAIPAQTLILWLTPSSDPVAQVIDTREITFQTPALYPAYAAIKIRCGDQMLAEITDIETVQ